MFFQKIKTSEFSQSWFLFLHFLRLHQVVYQLTLVTIILFFTPNPDLFELFSAVCMIVLITPTFLLVQDLLGRKDDEKVNQKRLVFSERMNKIFFFFSVVIMGTLLLLNNIESFICYILLFISTLSYASAKHFRKMILAYFFRYMSSLFTLLLYIYILFNGLFSQYYFLILLVPNLDLVGNIAGDLRDFKKDSKAGVKTLMTTKGKSFTIQIMAGILISTLVLLTFYFQSILVIFLMIFIGIQFFFLKQMPIRFSHGIFHLGKIVNFLVITGIIAKVPVILLILSSTIIILLWIVSYYFYLLNSGTSSHA